MGEIIFRTEDERLVEHNPQHAYDCDNCKYSLDCGFLSKCNYDKVGLPPAPPSLIKIINTHRLINSKNLYFPPTPAEVAFGQGISDAMTFGYGGYKVKWV